MAMECYQDWSLRHIVDKFPLNEMVICRYLQHILEGLRFLHSKGFVHGNLTL